MLKKSNVIAGLLLVTALQVCSCVAAEQGSFHDSIFRLRKARTGRMSSWDRTGGNLDWFVLQPGETKELLKLAGPGVITHIYFTSGSSIKPPSDVVLRMYWDDETDEIPSVEVPFGAFFCTGDNLRLFASHFVSVNQGLGTAGYNAYFPMPFRKLARITLQNNSTSTTSRIWYHIEYELYEQNFPADIAYFHAQWRQEKTTRIQRQGPEAVPEEQVNQVACSVENNTGAENYIILEAEGTGHVVGLFLTCNNLAGGWWGEGDDMIFIDGEKWPPSYHGTGTEEIFGGGACPNEEYSGPYTGFVAIDEQKAATWRGQNSMYRWYVHDPIRFQRSIRWTIEHGAANNFENDYSSVAYWYQTEPHKLFPYLSGSPGAVPTDGVFDGLFVDQTDVKLTYADKGVEIRYTLDGTEPTKNSPVYTKPIKINQATTIMTMVFKQKNGNLIPIGDSSIKRRKTEYRPAIELGNPVNGVNYAYYEGNWNVLPDFSKLKPVRTGKCDKFVMQECKDLFAFKFTGYFKAPKDGIYSFYTTSDDGSQLYIGDKLVVNNDGIHGPEQRAGQIALKAGFHPITVTMFEAGGDEALDVYFAGPDTSKKLLTKEVLFSGTPK